MNKASDTTLELNKLSFSYQRDNSDDVLCDVDACFHSKEISLIVGANGAGKSTLLNLAAGLISPTNGNVLINKTPNIIGNVGLVFQNASAQLFCTTVKEELMFAPKNFGFSEAEALKSAQEALGLLGLDSKQYFSRSPLSLSGGEARRVAIASILSYHPKALLFDEPNAGLDIKGKQALRALLQKLKELGTILVIVSHDLELFLPLADTVYELKDKKLVKYDSANQFITDNLASEHGGTSLESLNFQRELEALSGLTSPMSLNVDEIKEYVSEVKRRCLPTS